MIGAIDKAKISVEYLYLNFIHNNTKVSPSQFECRKHIKNRWQCAPSPISFFNS